MLAPTTMLLVVFLTRDTVIRVTLVNCVDVLSHIFVGGECMVTDSTQILVCGYVKIVFHILVSPLPQFLKSAV